MGQDISPDFPFESRFIEVHGSRIHFIEQGTGDPILFLHGNPTSSYLWRNIIPHAASVGRAIAMDLVGMGKSDKPDIEYRFVDHYRYVLGFIEALELKRLTLVMHDWGSGLGFHYASQHEGDIKGLAFMEAILFSMPEEPPEGTPFRNFRTPDVGWDLIVNQNAFIEQILPSRVIRSLTDREMDRYREPFQDPTKRKPIWRWPNELPMGGNPPDVVAIVDAYRAWLEQTELPKLLFYGNPGSLFYQARVTWCREHLRNLKAVDIGEASHFLQEDNPRVIGVELAEWYRSIGG